MAGGVAQVVKSKLEALSLNPSAAKKKKMQKPTANSSPTLCYDKATLEKGQVKCIVLP
jgi:hypothetical protein